jgi:uncharacterized protein with HEPN domain
MRFMRFESDSAILQDILYHLGLVQEFTAGRDYEAFRADILRLYGAIRCLEIISEASRRLSRELKARHPDIQWAEMAAAGNVYRHEYEQVSARRVWDTIQLALPPLQAVVLRELEPLGPEKR